MFAPHFNMNFTRKVNKNIQTFGLIHVWISFNMHNNKTYEN